MLYFDTLPKILTSDEKGNLVLLTNIMTRAKLLNELQNNPMLFYTYAIQDGDTPEIIAYKYYGNPNRYWLVTYANQILDPVWDWPLEYQQFLQFIDSKYKDLAESENMTPFEYANSTIYSYEKITNITNIENQVTTTTVTSIDEDTFNTLEPSENTYTLPNLDSCTISITKNAVSIYDHEYALNEDKRNIKILNSNYAGQMEDALYKVMNK